MCFTACVSHLDSELIVSQSVVRFTDDTSFTVCGVFQFLCEPNDVYAVKKELEARQLPVRSAEVIFFSTSTVPMDPSNLELMAKVLEKLEEHPDVLKVYTNVAEASQWNRYTPEMWACGMNSVWTTVQPSRAEL